MRWLVSLWLLVGATSVLAQDADQCEAVLNAALASLETECKEQLTGTVCYGNASVSVALTESTEAAAFQNPGDSVVLDIVETLSTGEADIPQGQWGLVRFTPRVNLSDDDLTMLMLGDATVENTGSAEANLPAPLVPVTFPEGANIRAEPDPNAEQTGIIYVGNSVRTTGILTDGTWVRITDEEGTVGWVTVTAFDTDDLAPLAPVSADDEIGYAPMQSFTLETNDTQNASCEAVPPAGVLIQTPADVETARLSVNGNALFIPPESTVLLRAGEDEILQVDVLEGRAAVGNLTVEMRNGVTLLEGEAPIPAPYDYNALAALPVERLPRAIFVPIDFSTLVRPAPAEGSALAGLTLEDACTIAATSAPVNLRETPNPGGRVRHVMQIGESALPDARAQGADGVLWWRLAEDVWISSTAVTAVGGCGRLPLLRP